MNYNKTLKKRHISIGLQTGIMFIILINNFIYQTAYQINQVVFNLVVLLMLLTTIIVDSRISIKVIGAICFLCILDVFYIYFSDDNFEINRVINYSLIFTTYIVLFYRSKYISIPKSVFFICSIVFFGTSMLIFLLQNRSFINPNWYAMTFFYILVLGPYRGRLLLYLIALVITYFFFESRGTTVSLLAAIIVTICMKKFVSFTRYSITFFIILISVFYFLFLDFYTNNIDLVDSIISS